MLLRLPVAELWLRSTMNSDLEATLTAILGNEMAQINFDTQAIAGYDLPPEARTGFLAFHKFITDPAPNYISDWRASKETEHCYHRHVNGVLGDA